MTDRSDEMKYRDSYIMRWGGPYWYDNKARTNHIDHAFTEQLTSPFALVY